MTKTARVHLDVKENLLKAELVYLGPEFEDLVAEIVAHDWNGKLITLHGFISSDVLADEVKRLLAYGRGRGLID